MFGNFFHEFRLFGIMFAVIFFITISIVAFFAVRAFRQWGKDKDAPRLTLDDVTIVTKRFNVGRKMDDTDMISTSLRYTSYYVTFETDCGERMELRVRGSEYGMLVEGDRGRLTFQGTWFVSFQRM